MALITGAKGKVISGSITKNQRVIKSKVPIVGTINGVPVSKGLMERVQQIQYEESKPKDILTGKSVGVTTQPKFVTTATQITAKPVSGFSVGVSNQPKFVTTANQITTKQQAQSFITPRSEASFKQGTVRPAGINARPRSTLGKLHDYTSQELQKSGGKLTIGSFGAETVAVFGEVGKGIYEADVSVIRGGRVLKNRFENAKPLLTNEEIGRIKYVSQPAVASGLFMEALVPSAPRANIAEESASLIGVPLVFEGGLALGKYGITNVLRYNNDIKFSNLVKSQMGTDSFKIEPYIQNKGKQSTLFGNVLTKEEVNVARYSIDKNVIYGSKSILEGGRTFPERELGLRDVAPLRRVKGFTESIRINTLRPTELKGISGDLMGETNLFINEKGATATSISDMAAKGKYGEFKQKKLFEDVIKPTIVREGDMFRPTLRTESPNINLRRPFSVEGFNPDKLGSSFDTKVSVKAKRNYPIAGLPDRPLKFKESEIFRESKPATVQELKSVKKGDIFSTGRQTQTYVEDGFQINRGMKSIKPTEFRFPEFKTMSIVGSKSKTATKQAFDLLPATMTIPKMKNEIDSITQGITAIDTSTKSNNIQNSKFDLTNIVLIRTEHQMQTIPMLKTEEITVKETKISRGNRSELDNNLPNNRNKNRLPFPRLNKRSSSNKVEGYSVLVREKKRWTKIPDKVLPYNEAMNLGGSVVDNSASASFKLVKGKINVPYSTRSKYANKIGVFDSMKFNQKGNSLIEKNTFRIDTRGEVQGISALGWLKSRKKVGI